MPSYVFESEIMSLNAHFKSQKWKAFAIMVNFATHSLKDVGRGNHLLFNLGVEQYYLSFSYPQMLQVWYHPWIKE